LRFGKQNKSYWRCSNRLCKAKAIAIEQEDGKIIGGLKGTHNHMPQPEQRLVEIKRQELKQRAREEPSLSCSKLIASIRAGCDDETFVALGSDHTLANMALRFFFYFTLQPNRIRSLKTLKIKTRGRDQTDSRVQKLSNIKNSSQF